MINNIAIANFQSHRETILDLSPGVNVIVGPSDSGKTAIIRALRWLAWNRPTGEAFRSRWGGDTLVRVQDNNGYAIERLKNSKGMNIYRFQDEVFEGFGTDVPDKITEILNIDEVNLQFQLDAHFLISLSPGEVARYFNQVAHLEKIDSGLKNINSWIRQLDNKRGFLVEQQGEFEEELKSFEYLDQAEADLEVLEEMDQKRSQLQTAANNLANLIAQARIIDNDAEVWKELVGLEPEVDAILEQRKAVELLRTEEVELRHAANELVRLTTEQEEAEGLIELEPEVATILAQIGSTEILRQKAKDLLFSISEYEKIEDGIDRLKDKIEQGERLFYDYLGETCPLCGTNLSNQ